jgi:hypothetical protein
VVEKRLNLEKVVSTAIRFDNERQHFETGLKLSVVMQHYHRPPPLCAGVATSRAYPAIYAVANRVLPARTSHIRCDAQLLDRAA